MTLNADTGIISGTPTSLGVYPFTTKVVDSSGVPGTKDFAIAITPGSGGPDSFGYTFKDSSVAGGPVYDWMEIKETGTEILKDTDYADAVSADIGFTFNYYGTEYTQLAISSRLPEVIQFQ